MHSPLPILDFPQNSTHPVGQFQLSRSNATFLKGIAMLMLDHCTPSGGGMSRRNFLRVGTLALGGLTLADLLRQRAAAGSNPLPAKSVVMIHLSGGPSHLDMYDMKPLALSMNHSAWVVQTLARRSRIWGAIGT
jgi:hypothetical protein